MFGWSRDLVDLEILAVEAVPGLLPGRVTAEL
jgi:hypothetical protein